MGSVFPFGFLNGPATANNPGTMDKFILSTSRPITTQPLQTVPWVSGPVPPGVVTTNLPGAWPVAAPGPAPAPAAPATPNAPWPTVTISPPPGYPVAAPPQGPPAPAPPANPPAPAAPGATTLAAPTPSNAPPALPGAPVITTAPTPLDAGSQFGPFGPLAANGGWGPWGLDHSWCTGPWTSWWGGASVGADGCPGSTWSGWTAGDWSTSAPWTTWTACTGSVTGTTTDAYTYVTGATAGGASTTLTTTGPITEYAVAEATGVNKGQQSVTGEGGGGLPKAKATNGFAQGGGNGSNYSSGSAREAVDPKVLVAGSLLAIAIGVLGWL